MLASVIHTLCMHGSDNDCGVFMFGGKKYGKKGAAVGPASARGSFKFRVCPTVKCIPELVLTQRLYYTQKIGVVNSAI